MLEFWIDPAQLRCREQQSASLCIAAPGGACTNVSFELRFPREIRALGISSRIRLDSISPSIPARLPMRLTAEAEGNLSVEIRNLSYRSRDGEPVNEALRLTPVQVAPSLNNGGRDGSPIRISCN